MWSNTNYSIGQHANGYWYVYESTPGGYETRAKTRNEKRARWVLARYRAKEAKRRAKEAANG